MKPASGYSAESPTGRITFASDGASPAGYGVVRCKTTRMRATSGNSFEGERGVNDFGLGHILGWWGQQ